MYFSLGTQFVVCCYKTLRRRVYVFVCLKLLLNDWSTLVWLVIWNHMNSNEMHVSNNFMLCLSVVMLCLKLGWAQTMFASCCSPESSLSLALRRGGKSVAIVVDPLPWILLLVCSFLWCINHWQLDFRARGDIYDGFFSFNWYKRVQDRAWSNKSVWGRFYNCLWCRNGGCGIYNAWCTWIRWGLTGAGWVTCVANSGTGCFWLRPEYAWSC